MSSTKQPLDALQDIKQMMERSSRFISLSGLSGVSAGICALVGAWFAYGVIYSGDSKNYQNTHNTFQAGEQVSLTDFLSSTIFLIALFTFFAALALAFTFTWLRSQKTNVAIWGVAARRLMWHVFVPMVAGGIFLYQLVQKGNYYLVAPGCLIFYGLALLNAGKYTLGEIKYLGYIQVALGVISCGFTGYGLYFWAVGFGIMHIVYGTYMWVKYEKNA